VHMTGGAHLFRLFFHMLKHRVHYFVRTFCDAESVQSIIPVRTLFRTPFRTKGNFDMCHAPHCSSARFGTYALPLLRRVQEKLPREAPKPLVCQVACWGRSRMGEAG